VTRNVTIALEDATARWARVEAARQDVSLSRFVADLLIERMGTDEEYAAAMRSSLARKPLKLRDDPSIPYPTREELHDRAGLR
jgi:hypothetical protein